MKGKWIFVLLIPVVAVGGLMIPGGDLLRVWYVTPHNFEHDIDESTYNAMLRTFEARVQHAGIVRASVHGTWWAPSDIKCCAIAVDVPVQWMNFRLVGAGTLRDVMGRIGDNRGVVIVVAEGLSTLAITNADIVDASIPHRRLPTYDVVVTFTDEAADRLSALDDEPLVVVLDGERVGEMTVNADGRTGFVTGDFTGAEAQDLAFYMRIEPLPTRMGIEHLESLPMYYFGGTNP